MGPVYHITSDTCDASYTSETERSLEAWFVEHKRHQLHHLGNLKSYIIDNPEHQVDMDGVKFLAVELRWFE